MIVGSVCAFSSCCGVAVLTFLGMSRQLPVTTALHPASGETPNFCQSPLFFCAQRLDHFNAYIRALGSSIHSGRLKEGKVELTPYGPVDQAPSVPTLPAPIRASMARDTRLPNAIKTCIII